MSKSTSPTPLTAGPLSVVLENDRLRSLRFGSVEILHSIYFAVRDANWGTVPSTIEAIDVRQDQNTFGIDLEVGCRAAGIDFRWTGRIRAERIAAGRRSARTHKLTFEAHGKAHSDFLRNRISFCVLHPLSCQGREVVITHPDKSASTLRFPHYISPHQPFKNIQAMRWSPENLTASLRFTGEIFETEDQRNWSDASYKTYGTPLNLPFPVAIHPGDEVRQRVELEIVSSAALAPVVTQEQYVLRLTNNTVPLPPLGLEANEEPLSEASITELRKLNLSHLRVEARTHESHWWDRFRQRLQQAQQLNLPIELVIFLRSEDTEIIQHIREVLGLSNISRILVIDPVAPSTLAPFLGTVLPVLRQAFPNVAIGGGTDYYFTQLNRFRPPTDPLDFVSFSTNPQVHAFDDRSLLENNQTLPHILETARHLAGELPVYVSPITLKPRANPDATEAVSPEQQRRARQDHRQTTTFGAQWTLTCIKQLTQSGAARLTLYQTIGDEGVLRIHSDGAPIELFPVFALLETLGKHRSGRIRRTTSSHPLIFDGLILESAEATSSVSLIANFSTKEIKVHIKESIYLIKPKEISLVLFQVEKRR